MTDSNSYIPQDSPQLEFVYNNESDLQPRYWPVFYSQFVNNREANELYNDDLTQYITYSGSDWKKLMVSKEKDGRYKNFTMKSFSGESFDFYFQLGSLYSGSPSFYSGPTTISGAYKVLTYYSGEADAVTNCITFTAPTDNTSVFVLPDINTSNYIKLHHRAVASGESYRLSQFLPRTLIQVDDLEADVIDAVTIRVSDSIVVTADDLADGSITGDKILAGTISGVLITPGTITANEIDVAQLDAIASNMGTLFVNSGITIGDEGFLWTGDSISGEVLLTKEGTKIRNAFSTGAEVFAPGGGTNFVFAYVPRSRLVRYYPSNYTTSGLFDYNLTTYSGSETYFDISATQIGKVTEFSTSSSEIFNAYESRILTGYPATSGMRNDYSSSSVRVIGSGQASLQLSTSTWNTSNINSSITLNAGDGGNRITISGEELRVTATNPRIENKLNIYKYLSTSGPVVIEEFAPILDVSESRFRYVNPKDSILPSGPGQPTPVNTDLFVVSSGGDASLLGNFTISGTVTAISGIYGKSGSNVPYEASNNGIFFRDSTDNSTIFEASSSGLFVRSSTGNRIIDVSTSTGNLDLLGGDFFVYNSAETAIVASITKTGAAEFIGITNTGNIATTGTVIADTGVQVQDSNNYARVAASQSTLSTRSSTNALTFTVDTATGNTRAYGDFRVDANFTQFNYGSMTKNTAQTVNAGVTAKITFQVAGANGVLDDLTNNQINIVDAGLYLIVAGVVSTTLGLPWQVVSGGAFNSGVLLNGVTQADGRAYSSKMLYLNPGELELWLSNTGGTNAAISTGNNGAVLTVTKVG
jgi:hypothetical protein